MKSCVIVGAGMFNERNIHSYDLLIAADGGLFHLENLNLFPDIIIGDFDSLGKIPEYPNVIKLPKEKDETDMLAAIKYGINKNCDIFHIYGGMGGRFDHSLGNIQNLLYITKKGLQGFLYGEECIVTCVKNGSFRFPPGLKGTVSVFSLSAVSSNVTIKGLKYELNNAKLFDYFPVGVSNEFIGNEAFISVEKGTLLIMHTLVNDCP